ncbi:MAG: hypothetical protein HC817_14880 [Saprospiraceae bacterium]|nr:hypothetical protein [Saprospiraceae bacterium]
MHFNEQDLLSLKRKAERYREVINNTFQYRESWKNHLKNDILESLTEINNSLTLNATLEQRADIANLEAVVFRSARAIVA